ncbi:MAG: sugar phosphate isomerase/epimerase family protein [Paracoccaceae bacterium]
MAKLGIHTLALTPLWSPEDADRLLPPCKAHGVSVVETPLLDPATYDSAGTKAAMARHRTQLVCSLGLPEKFDLVKDPETVTTFLCAAIDAAGRAGSEVLSGVTYGTIGKRSGQPRTQAETDAIIRLITRAAAHAKRQGMRLGIEPCNRYETHLMNTGADGAWFVEQSGADNVFVHLDTYHMNIEEVSFTQGFADAGRHLDYIHLSESNRGVPGRGTVDWADVFGGLKAARFTGAMTVESFVHLAPELAGGLAVWRPVAKRAEDVIEVGLPFLIEEARKAGLPIELG